MCYEIVNENLRQGSQAGKLTDQNISLDLKSYFVINNVYAKSTQKEQ